MRSIRIDRDWHEDFDGGTSEVFRDQNPIPAAEVSYPAVSATTAHQRPASASLAARTKTLGRGVLRFEGLVDVRLPRRPAQA